MLEHHGRGVDALVAICVDNGVELVVIEDFLLRGRFSTTDREGLSPVHVTSRFMGRYEYVCPGAEFDVTQLAGQVKPVITNDRLRRAGLWVKGEHARDAVRHGVMYLRRAA